jgi:hypothetical protein
MKKEWIFASAIMLFTVFFMAACAGDGVANDEEKTVTSLLETPPTETPPTETPPVIAPVEVFERPPVSGITRNYSDILSVGDGWVAVGRSHGAPLDAIIVKYDKQGYKVWEKGFGTSDSLDEFYSIMEISGGYIVRANVSPAGRGISVIIKFDTEGNLIWAKDLSVNAIAVNETGFVGVGGVKSAELNTIFIAQFDTDGSILWHKQIGDYFNLYGAINPYWNEVLHISKIINSSDGYFLYGSSVSVLEFTGTTSDGPDFIAYLNTDGTFCWQKTIDINNVDDVILAADGIVAAGAVYADAGRMPFVKKYDFEMNLIWEVPYEQNSYIVFQKLAKVGEDVFVSVFRAGKGGAFVSGISADGERFWDSDAHINETEAQYPNIFAIDGGFAVNVYHSSSGGNTFLIYDSDSLTVSAN